MPKTTYSLLHPSLESLGIPDIRLELMQKAGHLTPTLAIHLRDSSTYVHTFTLTILQQFAENLLHVVTTLLEGEKEKL